jgi:glycerophosphoryl diester phosphodiesterase
VTDGPLLAVAHRAGNSLAGLRTALELGADVVEADVNAHRGRLEVRHLKTMGPLPLLWDRWELRSARSPRLGLETLLAAADGGATFMLDLKGGDPAVGAEVARELHERAPERPVLVCSRNWAALAPFTGIGWVRTVRSARTRRELRRLLAVLDVGVGGGKKALAGAEPYGVSVHRSLLDPDAVAALHRYVEVVMTWPINDDAALDAVLTLRGSGSLGVISDEPAVLARLVAER